MNNYISSAIHSSHSDRYMPVGRPEQIQHWVITFWIAEEHEAYFIYLILVWLSGCFTEKTIPTFHTRVGEEWKIIWPLLEPSDLSFHWLDVSQENTNCHFHSTAGRWWRQISFHPISFCISSYHVLAFRPITSLVVTWCKGVLMPANIHLS